MKTDNYTLRVFVVSLLTTIMVSPAGAQSINSPMPPPKEMSFETPVDVPVVPKVDYTGIGTIAGIVRNAEGKPVASAMVTATRIDQAGIKSTISGSDGVYSFGDLPSGLYRVTTDTLGATVAVTPAVQVLNGRAVRFDLGGVQAAPTAVAGVKTAPVSAPTPASAPVKAAVAKPASAAPVSASASAKPAAPTAENNKFWRNWLDGNSKTLTLDNQLRNQAYERAERAKALAAATVAPAAPTAGSEAAESATVASLGNAPIAAALDRPAPDAPAPDPQAAAPAAPAAPAKPPLVLPEPLSAPDPPPPGVDEVTPFAYADFSWMNGQTRNNPVLDTKFYTPELRWDSYYMLDTNQPIDHTMGGSTEQFRSGEFQIEQVSVGGDFHWDNVRGRVLYMDGLFATTTPRNDASDGVGQWDLRDAYKYFSEAWGGYHWDGRHGHGFNIDVGIFVSYIGLFSYYNFDNWTYQPSYVSSNTPWFFNGLRIQYFVTNKLKIEPWIVNGWQSYAKYNGHKGLGGQILWLPTGKIKVVANTYGNGTDDLGVAGRSRIHIDDSFLYKFYEKAGAKGLSKAAFTFTGDIGCEYGAGVSCMHNTVYNPATQKGGPNQDFVGTMAYLRGWFDKDLFAFTLGAGVMSNPGRYLTLLPPINGATAQTGTPYFEELPGDKAFMYDTNLNFQWMPKQYITWWLEAGYRHSNVPYWSGRGGITPPAGDTLNPGDWVCASGADAGVSTAPSQGGLAQAEAACGGGKSSVWFPDLREGQLTFSGGVLVKF